MQTSCHADLALLHISAFVDRYFDNILSFDTLPERLAPMSRKEETIMNNHDYTILLYFSVLFHLLQL